MPAASLTELCAGTIPPLIEGEPLMFVDGTTAPPYLATRVRVYWSSLHLTVLFAGKFLELRYSQPASHVPVRTPKLYELGDVYEVFVGRESPSTGRYREFQVSPGGDWLDVAVWKNEKDLVLNDSWISGCRCASIVFPSDHIWTAALEIPWSALREPGEEGDYYCNFYRATGRFHGDELLAWSPTGGGANCFHRPERFGMMKLMADGRWGLV